MPRIRQHTAYGTQHLNGNSISMELTCGDGSFRLRQLVSSFDVPLNRDQRTAWGALVCFLFRNVMVYSRRNDAVSRIDAEWESISLTRKSEQVRFLHPALSFTSEAALSSSKGNCEYH